MNQIIYLKNELKKANDTIQNQNIIINDLKNKLNNSYNEIIYYKNNIQYKELELNNLKLQLNNNNLLNKSNKIYYNDMMCVNFISTDGKLHFAIPCSPNDIFAEIEEKLYKEFPEYRETNNNFLANGQSILRFKTIAQNKIGNGYPITLIAP